MKKHRPPSPLKGCSPSVQLICKLGSLIVHADEAFSADGREVDKITFLNLLKDAEVQQWLKDMGPLLPVKRASE